MKFKLTYFLFPAVCVLQDDNQKDADNEKDAKKKEVIFQ
jgi:hypothetical protein